MFDALLTVLSAGLTLWSDKEKNKYIDEMISLKNQYYEEYNKPLTERDDSVLDNLEHELCVLGVAFAASIGKQNTAPKS